MEKGHSFHATLVIISIMGIALSCSNSETKLAKKRYEQAQKLYHANEFNNAKLILDSIIEYSQGKNEYHSLAKKLMNEISINEQKQNLVFLDSLLGEREIQLKTLKRYFMVDSIEGLPNRLVHFRQSANNSFNRTFIRPNLDENGTFFISSHYCGTTSIEHNQIKVYFDGNSALSEKIDYDDQLNRRYHDATYKWEIIQFRDGKDNGVVDFIAQNVDKPIKVQFLGRASYSIVMESFDKEAVRDSYEMSFIIKEILRIKKEKENAIKLLKQYE
ncbi:MAG: hypothetical protein QM786_15805 [Breznakibacter sp.]